MSLFRLTALKRASLCIKLILYYSILMNKETLKYIYQQFSARPLPKLYARNYQLPIGSGKILTLVGVRRSDKTFLLFELIEKLKKQGVAPDKKRP